MPFVKRSVEPKHLSRASLKGSDGKPLVSDQELQAVTNCTLSSALKQLASLVILANDIFCELREQLDDVANRSQALQIKITKITARVELYDPKKVTVPEGSLSDFAEHKVHYKAIQPLRTSLFVTETRPQCVQDLYEAASKAPALGNHSLNSLRQQNRDLGDHFLCTPVLGAKRRKLQQKIDVDIETRLPAVVADLRKWTSSEAIGEVTALPDASSRIAANVTLAIPEDALDSNGYNSGDDEPIDHKLPSPEEQFQVIISKFAPELVPIDTSGRFFDRMCNSRRSLLNVEISTDQNKENIDSEMIKRRTRPRKSRGKRRNTISGTDQKELREAVAGDATNTLDSPESADSGAVMRSHSSDLLKRNPIDPMIKKQSHFNTLKQWGKNRLKLISKSPSDGRDSSRDKTKIEKSNSSVNKSTTEDIDDINIYETVTMRRQRSVRNQENKLFQSRKSAKSLAVPMPNATSMPVKLRESSLQRRQRRIENKEDPHSSSGNWSASSESGRTSIGSEITTTTIPPKSTTSAGTSSNSLNIHSHGPPSSIVSRRRFLNTSGSSSVTSDGTLTPDIIHDLHEDLETSSEYSCDTEGYYTSFHMDSGLKTLKEEEILMPSTPLHTTNTLSSSGNQSSVAENEYELFGKGSTSTTTSSAGTVCTALMAAGSDRSLVIGPVVPERKSSLSKINKNRLSHANNIDHTKVHKNNSSFEHNSSFRCSNIQINDKRLSELSLKIDDNITKDLNYSESVQVSEDCENVKQTIAIIHSTNDIKNCQNICGTDSPDSGHNTSSSPIDDSVSSPQGKNSCSEQEFSESSDLEGVDRIERLRVKTTINSSRIPSICVITPANSDDESVVNVRQENKKSKNTGTNNKDRANINPYNTAKIGLRPKLELPTMETNLDTDTTSVIGRTITAMDCDILQDNHLKNKNVKTEDKKDKNPPFIKSSLLPLNNLMCKLKGVLPNKLTKKIPINKEIETNEMLYSDVGDYVTIADVRNNNQKVDLHKEIGGVYYSNDIVKRNLQAILSGNLKETEYVSLNELPLTIAENKNSQTNDEHDTFQRHSGAKVTLDAEGKVVYSSDSIRRRKGAHTTFEPGPFVKEKPDTQSKISPELDSPKLIRHIPEVKEVIEADNLAVSLNDEIKPSQRSKIIIKASNTPHGKSTTEVIKLPPATIIKATSVMETKDQDHNLESLSKHASVPVLNVNVSTATPQTTIKGAFVNIQHSDEVSPSSAKPNKQDYRHSTADRPYLNIQKKTKQFSTIHSSDMKTLPQNTRKIIPVDTSIGCTKTLPRNYVMNLNNEAQHAPDITRNITQNTVPLSITTYQGVSLSPDSSQIELTTNPHLKCYSESDSFNISPIDPKDYNKHFYSSTPSKDANLKDETMNLAPKLLSPVKSTMTNEELYAVIHKSKKKMNIKDSQIDRAGSPALSATSLSPVNSESSITNRIVPLRAPETGYLTAPRNRLRATSGFNEDAFGAAFKYNEDHQANRINLQQRFGPQIPQTSRMDFKRLLLQHGVKINTFNPTKVTNKISAVEQLKQSKDKAIKPSTDAAQNISKINILDLSSSPKAFMNRKPMRNIPPNTPLSPSRLTTLAKEHKVAPKILLSPKQQWRFSSPRSDVLSSPIPEAFNEDDSPNSSNEREKYDPFRMKLHNNQYTSRSRRSLIPTIKENVKESPIETQSKYIEKGVSALAGTTLHGNIFTNQNLPTHSSISSGISRAEYIRAQKEKFLNEAISGKNMASPKSMPISRRADINEFVYNKRRTPSPPALETAL